MGLRDWFGKKQEHSTEEIPQQFPWDRRPSIYEYVQACIRPGEKGLADDGASLPDEEQVAARSQVRWAAGALDGVLTHHMGGNDPEKAAQLLALVLAYCASPTVKNKAAVYDFLLKKSVVSFLDPFLESLQKTSGVNHQRLYDLAKSLAIETPDREPVKFGISILGLFGQESDLDVFRTLGRHDEFTLFCAVALGNACENGEEELWKLAQHVHGWGRIHIVERLASTENLEIKAWLLREGYKNSVMSEYLAYFCALGGGLLAALSQDHLDDELLDSAGEIIQALIRGGPAAGIDEYDDAAAAVELYLDHLEQRASSLPHLLAVATIRDFLADDQADWEPRAAQGWTTVTVAVRRQGPSAGESRSRGRQACSEDPLDGHLPRPFEY